MIIKLTFILLTAFSLLSCSTTQKQTPPPQVVAPEIETPRELWRIPGIGIDSKSAIVDARKNMRRNVYERVVRWSDTWKSEARQLFKFINFSAYRDYMSLASDSICADIPASVQSYPMNDSWAARFNIDQDKLENMFRRYSEGGAKYLQPPDRKKYKSWCLEKQI